MVFKVQVKNTFSGAECFSCGEGVLLERTFYDSIDHTISCNICAAVIPLYKYVKASSKEINEFVGKLPEPIYISGPITGMPNGNKEAFFEMEEQLLAVGYTQIINPRKLDTPQEFKDGKMEIAELWKIMMKQSVKDMMDCNSVVFLDGWENSRGAKIEFELAKEVGMKCVEVDLGFRSYYNGKGYEYLAD